MAATTPGPTLRNPPRRRLRLLMKAAAGPLRGLAESVHRGSRDNRSRKFFFFKSSVSGLKDSRRPTPRFLSADLNLYFRHVTL